jgi:hypothetical protein
MLRSTALVLIAVLAALPREADGQARNYSLESPAGIRLHNVAAVPAEFKGRKGLRVTISPETMRRAQSMTPEQQSAIETLAVIEGLELSDGVIEAEIAGSLAPEAGPAARGFVGIAFRLQSDMRSYDAFYLRPTNGRAEDQERRNHTAQYISHPDWPWFRLRRENSSKYESYVDLAPDEWINVRIEVRGEKARLFVHGQEHATLIVNDLKTGTRKPGAIALWIGPGTVAHFRNLTVRSDPFAR